LSVGDDAAGCGQILNGDSDRFEQCHRVGIGSARLFPGDDFAQFGADVARLNLAGIQGHDQVACFLPGSINLIHYDVSPDHGFRGGSPASASAEVAVEDTVMPRSELASRANVAARW
jgi:hypothetical protein